MNALLQIGLSNAVVCGIMAMLLLPVSRRLGKPALTHALSLLILLKLLTPPLLNVPVLWHWQAKVNSTSSRQTIASTAMRPVTSSSAPPADTIDDLAQAAAEDEATARPLTDVSLAPRPTPAAPRTWLAGVRKAASDRWRSWLLASWIGSAALLGALSLSRLIRLGVVVRRATVPGRDIAAQMALLSNRMGIRRAPRVRFIAGSAPPMLLALWHGPELIIPVRLWDRLEQSQRQTLLLHELAHLRRGDQWVRYVELLATCAYWWHPAVWFARWALREAEEQCCDAWVVWAMPHACRTYMSTILDAIDFFSAGPRPRLSATPVLASGMGQFHNLQRRLAMVREGTVQRRLGARGLVAVTLLAAVALPVGAKLARGEDRPPQSIPSGTPPAVDDTAPPQGTAAAAGPREIVPPAADDTAPRSFNRGQSARAQETARLENELQAARRQVDRLARELEAQKSQTNRPLVAVASPRGQSRANRQTRSWPRPPSLGYMAFAYQGTGPNGEVLAYDGRSRQLMWTLKVPLNAQSEIECYHGATLLIKSADGYTRLVNAEDGKVTQAWAPGGGAPAPEGNGINPFGVSDPFGPSNAGPGVNQPPLPQTARIPPLTSQDQEQRLERIEQTLRQLTDAVNQLSRQQNEHRGSSPPTGGERGR